MAVAVVWLVIVVAVLSKNLEITSINHDQPIHQDLVENQGQVSNLEKTSQQEATLIQPASSDANVSPLVFTDTVTTLHGPNDDSKKPPDLPNAHTITAQDFAEKTGLTSVQEPVGGGTNNDAGPSLLDPAADSGSSDKGKNPENIIDEQVLTPQNQNPNSATPDLVLQEGSNSISDNEHTIDEAASVDTESANADTGHIPNSDVTEDSQNSHTIDSSTSLIEFSHKICDDIKEYSNYVLMSSQQKHDAAWTSEAKSTLKYYMDKIDLAISLNKENCVKAHKANYEARSKALEGVIEFCRSNLKRENWNKLQKETKDILEKISYVVEKAESNIKRLPKDDTNYTSKKFVIEKKAMKEIADIASEEVKTNLSNLMNESIKTDEKDYENCLNEKPEKSMIEDTLKDIMKIKDYCA